MINNKELKDKFCDYLIEKWKNTNSLQQCINRFSLKTFDVFLLWLKNYRKKHIWYWELFSWVILPGLKYLKDDNFWNIYFKNKTYNSYKNLFISFMDFCKENKDYIDQIIFKDKKDKLEKSLVWNYWSFEKTLFIKNWHEFIKNDKWENGDKLRRYLSDIYLELNNTQIKILYDLFFDAYKKCSKVNYKNKSRDKEKKINAFDTAFFNLSDKLNNLNINEYILEKIKSLFWKYLNFIPIYREKINKTLNENTVEWSKIQDSIKEEIIYSIRDPKWANYDIVDWEVVAPISNFWKFDSDCVDYQENGNNSSKKENEQLEIEF